MMSYVKRNKIQLEVLDIVQLVRKSLKLEGQRSKEPIKNPLLFQL